MQTTRIPQRSDVVVSVRSNIPTSVLTAAYADFDRHTIRMGVSDVGEASVLWSYMPNPEEELLNMLNTLVGSGLLIDADFRKIDDRYWEIYATMSEEAFYKRNVRKAVIKQITDVIDNRYKIYTDIHLQPEHRHAD